MSTPADPAAARGMLGELAGQALPGAAAFGMSPRQVHLDRLYRYFRAQNYDACKVDWEGREIAGQTEHEQIVTSGAIPPGFYEAGGQSLPLQYRRPTAPFYLARVIVWRFTGLLFSAGKHPQTKVPGDRDTENYVAGLIEDGRLWAKMIEGRNFGGSMGSMGLGFSLVAGKPVFEVFDPRWCSPVFADPQTHELESLEIRYVYTDEVRDPASGQWVEAAFWYRRVIDRERDVVWPKVPVHEGDEPRWDAYNKREVVHGLGEVPCVWVQNESVPGAPDGDPDCHGAFDTIEAIDRLVAQGTRGIISNCDPTLVISSDADFDAVAKGSDNALKLGKGESAQYLEIDGKGPEAAFDKAEKLEHRVCKVTRCVLEEHRTAGDAGGAKTATQTDRDYSSMWERCDVFREQYGEKGVKRLLEKAIRACRRATTTTEVDADTGAVVRGQVILSPLAVEQEDGTTVYEERKLGPAAVPLQLVWPPYVRPTLQDAVNAVSAAAQAVLAQIIDRDTAARFVAPFFQVENVTAVLTKLKKEAMTAQAAQAAYGMPAPGAGYPGE